MPKKKMETLTPTHDPHLNVCVCAALKGHLTLRATEHMSVISAFELCWA